jgi:hypothetical protein
MLIFIIIASISFFTDGYLATSDSTQVSVPVVTTGECAVSEIYDAIAPESSTKVLTKKGDLEEIEMILVKTTIDIGSYRVTASRKAQNLYRIDGTSYFVETRYCYEYQYSANAVLVVDSNYGFNKGKIIF